MYSIGDFLLFWSLKVNICFVVSIVFSYDDDDDDDYVWSVD